MPRTSIPKVAIDFLSQLESGKILCLLPVPRIEIEREIVLLEHFKLYPRGSIDLTGLNNVSFPKQEFESIKVKNSVEIDGQLVTKVKQPELTWFQSGATMITPADYAAHALIAFTSEVDIFSGNHDDHKQVIARHSYEAERAMDTVRLDFCRMDLPATLPGRVGTLGLGNSFSTECFYNLKDHESYILGCEIVTHLVTCGLGLEFDDPPSIQSIGNGEVGHIIRRALAMMTEAFESNSETDKFVRAMSTLEFIAGGGEYMKMKDVKSRIAAHCAKDGNSYHFICNRFRRLTSEIEDQTKEQKGIRTQIVHMGGYLEKIIPNHLERDKLFRELQTFISASIADLLPYSAVSWANVDVHLKQRRVELGVG